MTDPHSIIFGIQIGIDNKNKLSFKFLLNIKTLLLPTFFNIDTLLWT